MKKSIKKSLNIRLRIYKGICVGVVYENKSLYITLPFVYVELS